MLKQVQHVEVRGKGAEQTDRKQSVSTQKDPINSDMKDYLTKKNASSSKEKENETQAYILNVIVNGGSSKLPEEVKGSFKN
jgi:hypothetical protein